MASLLSLRRADSVKLTAMRRVCIGLVGPGLVGKALISQLHQQVLLRVPFFCRGA